MTISSRPSGAAALPRRTQIAILLIAAIAVSVLAFALHFIAVRNGGAKPEAGPPPGTFRATKAQWDGLGIAVVREQTFQDALNTDGAIAFDDAQTTPVFSPYSGRVTRIIANPGDTVTRGAPLMIVDAAEMAQAQSDLAIAAAQVKLTVSAEQREHDLFLARAGARKDWLQSQSDLAAARAALDAVRNRLRILGMRDAEIDALQRAPQGAAHGADAAVRAPIAGTVVQREVAPGQNIQSGSGTPVYTIGNLHEVWAVANVRAEDASDVHVGDAVELAVPAWPDRVFTARLDWVAAAIDPATHRLPVRATVANADGALKPGMFAQVRILDGKPRTAPAVPRDAVVYEGDTARVYVAGADHTLALRQIRVGRIDDGLVEVRDGLSAGERVVTRGAVFIDRAATGN